MEGSLQSSITGTRASQEEARTNRYRQQLGLLVSEFWQQQPSTDETSATTTTTTTTRINTDKAPPNDNTEKNDNNPNQGEPAGDFWASKVKDEEQHFEVKNDSIGSLFPSRIVARHLGQSEPLKKPSTTPSFASKKQQEQVNRRRRHPGYIPASILLTNAQTYNDTPSITENEQRNGDDIDASSFQDFYFPTCHTCHGPIQAGAFGSSTRLVASHDGVKNKNSQISASQKRRERRKRKRLQEKQRQQKQTTSSSSFNNDPPLAKWYQFAQQQQSQQTPTNAARCQELHITCRVCREVTVISIPKRTMLSRNKTRKEQANAAVPKANESQKKRKWEPPVSAKNARQSTNMTATSPAAAAVTSQNDSLPKNEKKASLEGDFVPLMTSAVKPKKKKKRKKGGAGNPLLDFLSSLNDH